jgi:hypothetical protein
MKESLPQPCSVPIPIRLRVSLRDFSPAVNAPGMTASKTAVTGEHAVVEVLAPTAIPTPRQA